MQIVYSILYTVNTVNKWTCGSFVYYESIETGKNLYVLDFQIVEDSYE